MVIHIDDPAGVWAACSGGRGMPRTATPRRSLTDTAELVELGQQQRVDSVRAADAAGSGHPTSSMSAADLMAVLLAHHLRYDFDRPAHPGNDRFVLSKGHASPLLYAACKALGAVDDAELLTFRMLDSRLEGHPTPQRLPWVETATGSLGQGLPVGVGIALSGKRLERTGYRVWVLCGDSELAEGSVWEAAEHAAYEHLDNLTLIVDVNPLGQRGPTRHGHDLDAYARRFQAFGRHTVEVDGHDMDAVDRAYGEAGSTRGQPTVILARTLKGKGVASVQDREGLHGKPLPVDRETLRQAAEDTGCLLTVEDHHPEGGLGDAVLDAFLDGRPVPRLVRLAVRGMPGSASPAEQLHAAGIDAESIAAAGRLLVETAIVR